VVFLLRAGHFQLWRNGDNDQSAIGLVLAAYLACRGLAIDGTMPYM
jgi:hypothetical protein